MLDKKERNTPFRDHRLNFSSAGPGAHLQNTDFTPSYFINMNTLEETSTKKIFMNLDGRLAEYEKFNEVLFSNPRQPYFQQNKSSLFREIYMEEVSNFGEVDHIGCARQASGFPSEYSCDLLRTLLHSQDKQQCSMVSSFEETCLGKEKLKNNAYTSKELENIYLGKQYEPTIELNNRSLVERNSCVNATSNSERLAEIGDEVSADMYEQNKPTNRGVSPVISEKIWGGSLKLNTSTTVSAVAFFKSGEKVQDLNWPAHIEIKGKVRMQAFEKFIQELPRSRNRALMVISLCWKVGSCRSGLSGMMEVAKGYRETEKVGFAQIPPGIDLYICPRSDAIITILAKYGFFKGMAAVEEDQDSLIGCVVWRRSQPSTNYVSKDTMEKKTLLEEQPLNSTGLSNQGLNSSAMEAHECAKKQVVPSETELKAALDLPGLEAGTATALSDTTSMIIENKAAVSSSNSYFGSFQCSAVQTITSSVPYSCPLVPAQQKTSEKPSLNLLQENMQPADINPLQQNSGTNEVVLVSDKSSQCVSPTQMTPVFMLGNSPSSSVSQSLGNFGFGPAPRPRPLVPVNSSNFQFQPQLAQKTDSSAGNDSNCAGENLAPSLQASQPALPGPPPLPLELLHGLLKSNENVPQAIIKGGKLQDEIHTMHHMVTRGLADVLETRAPPLLQIQETCDASNGDGKEEEEADDDDLPEFDFSSACGEPEGPTNRFPGWTQQTRFPNAPPLTGKPSFEAPWSAGDPALLATRTESYRPMPSPLPSKLLHSNEGLPHAKNFGKFITDKTLSTEDYQFKSHSSCLKETKETGNNTRNGFGFKRKSIWDDDDDDMPEWCPPDLELPKQPLPSATTSARLLSGRPLPPPDTTAPISFHPCQNHDLQQKYQPGLLGPCPCPISDAPAGGPAQTKPLGEFERFSNPSKPLLDSHHRDSLRPRTSKFNRKPPPYAADGKRRRR
ncbi:uncharacterized protein LOC110031121 isoform X2 [Phalaenopsis equestris]|uniref:uncharacterized protein LOC110031121 isoform X2 n=1 Tax=Phalaenopsis equestris TaxID=78828 RepID=UPI0009E5C1A1|nr:uncharacterized protein LOC110031121 isoform X2 [Phalaenopsis equestris]